MLEDLKDKRVVVTAAGSGIGREIAEGFLGAGARVFVCDVDSAALTEVLESADGLEGVAADVAEPAQVEQLFQAAEAALGGLEVLVNNAGVAGPTAPLEEISLEDWRRTLAVNLDGMFLCLKRGVPLIKASGPGGAIVNLSSAAGLYGFPRRTPYAASKWGVIGLTKSLAHELGPLGIRVNCIAPAGMATAMVAGLTGDPEDIEATKERLAKTSPLKGRPGLAEDVANAALWLASDASGYVNGHTLLVDGGLTSGVSPSAPPMFVRPGPWIGEAGRRGL